MYILNINKSYGTNTPQILGRVADLPYMDFEFMFKDGTKAVDLTGCTVEFRGLTSTDNKIISTESVTPKDSKNGTINFKVPKNFYSAPGAFKRAYFAIKKNGRIDTTQDVIIHVLDSVDMDAQDAQDVIDVVDTIIADVEKQVKSETNRLIQQIQNDTASTIADSNKKLADLDKQINDFKTNTNSTISQINGELSKLNSSIINSNSEISKLEKRLDSLSGQIGDKNLITEEYMNNLSLGGRNLLISSDVGIKSSNYFLGRMGIGVEKPVGGKEYTLSFSGTLPDDCDSLNFYNSDGTHLVCTIHKSDIDNYGIFRKSFKWITNNGDRNLQIYKLPRESTGQVDIKWFKLEKGSKNLDWTPSVDEQLIVPHGELLSGSNEIPFSPGLWEVGWYTEGGYKQGDGHHYRMKNQIKTYPNTNFVITTNTRTVIVVTKGNTPVDKYDISNTGGKMTFNTGVGDTLSVYILEPTSPLPPISDILEYRISLQRGSNPTYWDVSYKDVLELRREMDEIKKAVTALGGS